MIVLGLLLILTAAGVAVVLVTAPTATSQVIDLSAVGVTISASPLALFIAGAASVALLGLGIALINGGARRKASSRKELRELRKGQTAEAAPTSAAAGQHSSRRDRTQKDGGANAEADTSATGSGTNGGPGTEADTDSSH